MVVTDLEGRARERDRQSWMLGNFTFSLPGPGKLPVDCECSHVKTYISTFFPFSFLFWFPFPGYCEPGFTGERYFHLLVFLRTGTRSSNKMGLRVTPQGESMRAVRYLFPNHVISWGYRWLARLPGLSTFDFSQWGYLKSEMSTAPPPNTI